MQCPGTYLFMSNTKIHRRNQQVERHLDLAERLARSFSQRTGLDCDDLYQVAVLGLIKATKAYRSETNVPFEAFARVHARGAILHYLRDSVAMVRLPRRIEEEAQRLSQIHQPKNSHEKWVQALYRNKNRWLPCPEELQAQSNSGLTMMVNDERRNAVQLAFAQLGDDEKHAIKAVVIDGRSLRNVGTSLGVSAMTIQRRVKKGLNQLKLRLSSLQAAP
jgi:RNA polymerase sigma-B factor